MKHKNIIIISSIDWDTQWQWHHEITNYLNLNNSRVLFIENTGTRRVKINELKRIINRIYKIFKSKGGFTLINKNLTLYTPFFFPLLPYNYFIRKINSFFINKKINKWSKLNNFYEPVVISFLPTPIALSIIKNVMPLVSVYLCADNYSSFSPLMQKIKTWENKFITKTDLVYTSSTFKLNEFKKISNNIYFFESGVNLEKFKSFDYNFNIPGVDLKKKIIGFHGALRSIIDKKLISKIALKFPALQIVLVGPLHDNFQELYKFNNIFFIDEVAHKNISKYVNKFDVGLIPYIKNNFTDSINPAKLNEYLILGKPVVSTNINEVEEFNKKNNGVIYVANGHDDFINKLDIALKSENTLAKKNDRINIAQKYSWNTILLKFFNKIEETEKYNKLNYSFKDKVLDLFVKSRKTLLRVFLSFALIILILISPFPSYMGSKLIVNEKIERSEAVVALTGPGEGTYYNFGYQKRYLHLKELSGKDITRKIYLISSVKKFLSETSIVKSLLINNGIGAENITILESDAHNSAGLISIVGNELRKNNFKKIIFLTSPYHSKRSELIWNKKFPEIQVIQFQEDNFSYTSKWFMPFSEMKIIFYEYLSIIYNFIKGNI